MKTIIVYHSFSGVTRAIAERVGAACNGDLVEVRPLEPYSKTDGLHARLVPGPGRQGRPGRALADRRLGVRPDRARHAGLGLAGRPR